MAQTGYTPLLIYASGTTGNAPVAGNLTSSASGAELALNYYDGKLFYKDNAGVVQILATKGTAVIGGSNTQVQYNSSGSFAGSANLTFDGTTLTANALTLTNSLTTANGGTGLSSYTAGDLIYYASGTALTKLGIGVSGRYLSSSGTAPQWTAPAALTKTDDTNVTLTLGGSASTALLNAASLTLGWTGQLSLTRGGTNANLTASAGSVAYSTASAIAFSAVGSSGQVLVSGGTGAPTWSSLSSIGVTTFSAGTTGFTPSTATSGAITLAGTLATTNGGTGLTSFSANQVFYASSTSAVGQSANMTFDGTTFTLANDASISGLTVGKGAGSVATNTTFGASALATNSTGAKTTALGYQALNLATGSHNTAVGYQAGKNTSTGQFNTFVGGETSSYLAAGYANTTGGNNTAIGHSALQANTTASGSVAVGVQALNASTGGQSTAVGYQAGTALTTGGNHVVIGYQAGAQATTGNYLILIGNRAGYGITTATTGPNLAIGAGTLNGTASGTGQNTVVGYNGLNANTTGSSAAAFGYQVLLNNTTGDYNSAFGSGALQSNTTGSYNTAHGYRALFNNTLGSNNTAVGWQAAYNTTSGVATFGAITGGSGYTDGTYNAVQLTYSSGSTATTYPTANITISGGAVTAVTLVTPGIGFKDTTTVLSVAAASVGGTGSGFSIPVATLVTASYNTAVGYQALSGTQTGGTLTAVGAFALYSNTTGSYNTAVGRNTLYTNTTGQYNVAIGGYGSNGNSTLVSNTTGSSNTALGGEALALNTTGSNNTALGYQALYSNTTGTNVAVGQACLYSNTTGTLNVAIAPYSAMYSNTTGGSNVAVGHQALYSNTTASSNIAIGYQAEYFNESGINNTAVGYQALYNTGKVFTAGSFTTGASYTIKAVGTTDFTLIGAASNTVGVSFTATGPGTGTGTATPNANYNVAIGYNAQHQGLDSGSNNISIGFQANDYVATGSNNIGIGQIAGQRNQTGLGNIAIGYSALSNNGIVTTAGSFVTGIVYTIKTIGTTDFTLIGAASNTVGITFTASGAGTGTGTATPNISYNVAVGYEASLNNTVGTINTAVGYRANRSNTTGNSIVAVGQNAAYNNTTGANNVAVGSWANGGCSTGSSNTMVGHYAGYGNNGTANNNTGVGYQAVYIGGQTGTILNNTGVGYQALYSSYGTTNTAIGYNSGSAITSGTKNTILGSFSGNQGGLDIRTASNYIVLSDGDGNPRAYWNAANATFGGTLTVGTTLTSNDAAAWYTPGVNGGVLALGNQIGAPARVRAFTPSTRGSASVLDLAFDAVDNAGNTKQVLQVGASTSLSLQGATPQSGTGITFPATQSASSDANTLDDYEEGTWTPQYTNATPPTTPYPMYTSDAGYATYTKVGNMVTVRARIFTTGSFSTAGAAGALQISGLPFAVASRGTSALSIAGVSAWSGNQPSCGYAGNTTGSASTITLEYRTASNGASAAMSATDLDASGGFKNILIFTCTYFAA